MKNAVPIPCLANPIQNIPAGRFNPCNKELTENKNVSNNLDYHLKNKISLNENIFRPNSNKFFELMSLTLWK